MTVARILAGLGVLVTLLSLLAGYIRFQGLDTETVKGTAEELIADDEVRDQVAASLVDALYANIDVTAARGAEAAARSEGARRSRSGGSARVLRAGSQPNARAPARAGPLGEHRDSGPRQLIKVLDDDTRALSTENGAVVLDLQPLVIQLGDRVAIVGNVAEKLGPDAGRVEIMQADQLETAQDLTQILKFLGMWLWLLPIALWAAALWIARDNRRSILRMIAVGSILTGLIVLVLRRVGGSYVVDSLVPSISVQPAAHDAWDILTSQLRDGGFTFIGLGVILLVALWLAGPSPSGVSVRRGLAPYLARPEIAYTVAGVLFLLLLWWSPTVQTTRVPLMLAAALFLGFAVELLRRQTAREVPAPPPPDLGGSLRRGVGRVRGQTAQEDRLAALERLGRLHEQGVLTDEEFAAEKAQLVGH